jgi:uncharacterized protein (DUF58 family)
VRPLALGPLLDAVRGIAWPARVRVRAGLPGAHRANQRGTSGEFTEFRAYRQGDDPRRLDWRLLARSDRAFVRVTDERAWWPTWLLVDASASMRFPEAERAAASGIPDKWTMARSLAVGLAAVAHATSDPVGVVVATRPDARRLPPRTRRGTVHAIARLLDSGEPAGDAPLAPLLARLPAGARVALITDALSNDVALVDAIGRLRVMGGELTLVHVVHPLELDPPDGVWQARDPEPVAAGDGRALLPATRVAYRTAFDAWRETLARRVQAAGARLVEVRCDEAPARAVRRIVTAHRGANP